MKLQGEWNQSFKECCWTSSLPLNTVQNWKISPPSPLPPPKTREATRKPTRYIRHPSQEYNGSTKIGVQYCFPCLCKWECWTVTSLLTLNYSDLLLHWINIIVKQKLHVTSHVNSCNRFNGIFKRYFILSHICQIKPHYIHKN